MMEQNKDTAPSAAPAALTEHEIYETMVMHCEAHGYPVDPEVIDSLATCVSRALLAAPPAEPVIAVWTDEMLAKVKDGAQMIGSKLVGRELLPAPADRQGVVLSDEEISQLIDEWYFHADDHVKAKLADFSRSPLSRASSSQAEVEK